MSSSACPAARVLQRTLSLVCASLSALGSPNLQPFQILKYEIGQFYRQHHDQNSGLFTPQGVRVYTFFMYLSTPEAGGATKFNNLGLTVPAVKGNAVLWPSVTSDDPTRDEPKTNHEALPVEAGQKFASNVWIHN